MFGAAKAAKEAKAIIETTMEELCKEIVQLREALARAGQERDELKADAVRFSIHLEQKDRALTANAAAYKELKQERDTLKAECERLRVKTEALEGRSDAHEGVIRNLEIQLTQAKEARKLCAVQMMALEEENSRLAGELARLRGLQ